MLKQHKPRRSGLYLLQLHAVQLASSPPDPGKSRLSAALPASRLPEAVLARWDLSLRAHGILPFQRQSPPVASPPRTPARSVRALPSHAQHLQAARQKLQLLVRNWCHNRRVTQQPHPEPQPHWQQLLAAGSPAGTAPVSSGSGRAGRGAAGIGRAAPGSQLCKGLVQRQQDSGPGWDPSALQGLALHRDR